jgi:hypothetical protein
MIQPRINGALRAAKNRVVTARGKAYAKANVSPREKVSPRGKAEKDKAKDKVKIVKVKVVGTHNVHAVQPV